MLHKLKLDKIYYPASELDIKNFEIRVNDRDFQTHDLLLLCEVDEYKRFTGKAHLKVVTYVFKKSSYVKNNHVVLSVKKIQNDYLNFEHLTTLSEPELNKIFKPILRFKKPCRNMCLPEDLF